MRKILFFGTAAFVGLSVSTHAQTVTQKIAQLKGMYPQYIAFQNSDAPAFASGSVVVEDAKQKIARQHNTLLLSSLSDAVGYTHYRYQQTLNGIPVEDAVYLVHVKGGKVLSENGRWIKEAPASLPSAASYAEAAALKSALQSVNAKVYRWQSIEEEAFLKQETENLAATYLPKGKLVYYAAGDDVTPQNLRLAYKFDVYALAPLSRQYVFVDAQNGKVLGTKELIHTVDGSAVTAYSGTRTIQTIKQGGGYTLQEKTRGKGIGTYNLKKTTSYSTAVNFGDKDNYWNNVNLAKDQYATDAHWGAEMTYDFYKTNFNRNSIDNAGFALKSYVHYSVNYFNAFWDGEKMTYGDGDASDNNQPLTALDVCGHEITHGLTTFTAALIYKNESGALNEGFSDIFGSCIEFFARPDNANWLIGSDFLTIRDMSNPKAFSQPDTYKGKKWATGLLAALDNGGVHTNSGVLNYWFYLLTHGGSGTNDKGTAYSVSGIGIDKAQAIAYRTLTTYLFPSSVYADARTYSVIAATDLYGEGSNEVAQVINAWDAVGVAATAPVVASPAQNLIAGSAPALTAPAVTVNRQYPNPVRNAFTVEFTAAKSQSNTLAVYSMSGAKVYQTVIAVNAGRNVVNITLPQIAPGTYLLQMNNEKVSTLQVIK